MRQGSIRHGHPESRVYCKLAYVGGCQNCGPFLGSLTQYGTYYLGYPKRTITLTTIHACVQLYIMRCSGVKITHCLPLVSREWKNGSNSSFNCTPFLHSLLTKGKTEKVGFPGFRHGLKELLHWKNPCLNQQICSERGVGACHMGGCQN